MAYTILRVDASARSDSTSVSRQLADQIIARATEQHPDATVIVRDVTNRLPLVDEAWITANFTPPEDRTPEQEKALALSDSLIAELKAADLIVIGVPLYNFGIPASLKAWVDMIIRVGVTFKYTETGPIGFLTGKKAILNFASGGTAIGSEGDFASTHLKFVLNFIGITDIQMINADLGSIDPEGSFKSAQEQVEKLVA